MAVTFEPTDHPEKEDLYDICYGPNANRARHVPDEDAVKEDLGKSGSCGGLLQLKLSSMFSLNGLHLYRGRARDDQGGRRPEDERPRLTKMTSLEDAALDTEHADVFDVIYIKLFYLKLTIPSVI